MATYISRLAGDFGLADTSAWAATSAGTFTISTIMVVVSCLLALVGMRRYFQFQTAYVIYATIALVVACIVLWVSAPTFHQTFNQWAIANHVVSGPDPYQTVINEAAKNGYSNPGFSWSATLGLVSVYFFIASWTWMSTVVAGEMKSAQMFKNQVIALVGSSLLGVIEIGLLVGVLLYAVGYDFLTSVVFSASTFPSIASTWDFFMRIVAPVWSMMLIDSAMMLMFFIFGPIAIYVCTRYMFAWSFDRVVPTKLAEVSDRFHVPILSIIICSLLTELLVYLLLFTGAVGLFSATGMGWLVSTFIVAVAVAIFPYRRKHIFEASPVKYRIAGIPAMTIAGLISALIMVGLGYYFATVPAIGGWAPVTAYVLLAELVSACLIFYLSKVYHQRKYGIDIGLAFQEIPPE